MATKTQDYDWLVKVIILGDSGIGKTNILSRFCDEKFTMTHMATIGVDFKIKTITVDGKRIKLQIWDTAGQERFRNITKTYYKGAYGVILTYSLIDRQSFENVENWIKVKKCVIVIFKKSIKDNTQDEITQILVGNKSDMSAERQVTFSEGKQLADQYNIPFLEVSAKENINIADIFQQLGKGIKDRLIREEQEELKRSSSQCQSTQNLTQNGKGKKEKKDCC